MLFTCTQHIKRPMDLSQTESGDAQAKTATQRRINEQKGEMQEQQDILLYQTEDGRTKIQVRLTNNTVWLTQAAMVELFQSSKANISEHIKHIFEEGELQEDAVVRKFRTTAADGKNYNTAYYNLDVVISVGYRVKSLRGTQFRIWATERLREYLVKGFTMNDDLLKQGGGYFEELLDRIRDIRSSEKVFYRKVLEIYATSIDYDPNAETTKLFFQTVQNKLHWAAHGHTAAEVIFERANAQLPFMGLTAFKGKKPVKNEITIAKNYLKEEELTMYMKDWIEVLDGFMKMSQQNILADAGKISAELAQRKALAEYETYKSKAQDELSEVEKQFLASIAQAEKEIKRLKKK